MSATNTPAATPASSTPRFARHVYAVVRMILIAAAAGALTAAIIAGTVQGIASAGHTTPAPAACHNPDLPSGDEQRLAGGAVLVCTDGVWHRP